MSNLLTPKELDRIRCIAWQQQYDCGVPRLLQHIEELEKALEQACDFTGIEYAKVLDHPTDYVLESFKAQAECFEYPELTNWLRTKEAGSGEGEKS